MAKQSARLAVNIGATFTDLVLDLGTRSISTKVPTTHDAPDRGVRNGVKVVFDRAGLRASDLSLVIHGTTLATSALIERKGACTALVTTEGFRDSLEITDEPNRPSLQALQAHQIEFLGSMVRRNSAARVISGVT